MFRLQDSRFSLIMCFNNFCVTWLRKFVMINEASTLSISYFLCCI